MEPSFVKQEPAFNASINLPASKFATVISVPEQEIPIAIEVTAQPDAPIVVLDLPREIDFHLLSP